MTTKTAEKRLEALEDELSLLRSAVIGILGRDPEGEYNPKYVKKILKRITKTPTHEFTDGDSFFNLIK